jgi:acyl-CoA synthetase (AMP-forming)/AMP-acid ligase II
MQGGDGTSVTFHGLDARASSWLLRHAPEAGTLKGRAVTFSAPNGIAWMEIFLGLLKAGAVPAPLDPAEPPLSQQSLARAIGAGFWWDGESLRALTGAARFSSRETCLIKLTSGTTGSPRALVFTAGQLLADGRQVASGMGIGPGDRNYALIPLGHSYGLGNLTIPLIALGIPLVIGSSFLPQSIGTDFATGRPTVFPCVPAVWRALAGSAVALPGLRLAISAGEPLSSEVARAFAARFGQPLHSFYGSSETGGISYDRTGASAVAGDVGQALPGVRLTALPGNRLKVASAAVLTHRNPRRAGRLGAWIMPDRATLDGQRRVTLRGRRGTTVKIAGRRVNLPEVAARVRRVAGVFDAWAGVSEGAAPVLGAVVATEQTQSQLRETLLADAAPWKVPKRIRVVASLPLTGRGKLDVRALRAMIS